MLNVWSSKFPMCNCQLYQPYWHKIDKIWRMHRKKCQTDVSSTFFYSGRTNTADWKVCWKRPRINKIRSTLRTEPKREFRSCIFPIQNEFLFFSFFVTFFIVNFLLLFYNYTLLLNNLQLLFSLKTKKKR